MVFKTITILKEAFKSIFSNKIRSFLTILGIVIGIASVIGLSALGQGATAGVTGKISNLGSTTLNISSGSTGFGTAGAGTSSTGSNTSAISAPSAPFGGGGSNSGSQGNPFQNAATLTEADLESILNKDSISNVQYAAGIISGSTVIKVGEIEERYTLTGVSLQYVQARKLNIGYGSDFNQSNYDNKENKIILGYTNAQNLFPGVEVKDIIGKTITIEKVEFTVQGILAEATESGVSNPNKIMLVTAPVMRNLFKVTNYSSFYVLVDTEKNMDSTKSQITDALLKNHKIDNPKLADFSIFSPKDIIQVVDQVFGVLTSFLSGVAAISLVVAGIGIMNIMLVSVTERTREIGIRKAVGASTWDIMSQFLVETVILTLIGCLFGILGGYGLAMIVGKLVGITAELTLNSIVLAVSVSSAVGLVFGMYPAIKAALLDPIKALKYE